MFRLQVTFAFVLWLCACAPTKPASTSLPPQPDEGRHVASPQDTHPVKSVGCVDISGLTTEDTPAEILPGMHQCIDVQDYDRGARLFAAADVYGRFDTLRVLDTSAHAVIPALESVYLGQLDADSAAKIQAKVKEISGSTGQLSRLCTQMRSLGPPTYYPSYMLLHGMSAFTGQGGGLKRDFNRTSAWESALKSVLHCPMRR